jgi:divinyl chlorophyllide a 8-vinyl-reductase
MAGHIRTGAPLPRRVFVLGATGTIGKATVAALLETGHEVVCLVRPGSDLHLRWEPQERQPEFRVGQVTDPVSLRRDGLRGERFDVMVSCLASRTGAARDAWALDHQAHLDALAAAQEAGISQFVLLSAICVQKPRLAFQHAKLEFEKQLIKSGLVYSIIRPTAFFKSLSGQFARVRQGKPFLVFGDGRLTATKPISDRDTARFMARCISDVSLHNRVLSIGGPGPAITPLQQAEFLFAALGLAPRVRHVPVVLLDLIVGALSLGGLFSSRLHEKAELARIGRYYATESMLAWNEEAGRYEADATPSTGEETLQSYYQRLAAGEAEPDRGAHRVF